MKTLDKIRMELKGIPKDGADDLATANQSDNTVSILLAKPDGTFAAKVDYPAGSLPTSIVAADFNNNAGTTMTIATRGWIDNRGKDN